MTPFIDLRKEKVANRHRSFFILLLILFFVFFAIEYFIAPRAELLPFPAEYEEAEENEPFDYAPMSVSDGDPSPAASPAEIDKTIVESIIFAGDGGNPSPAAFNLLTRESALLPERTRVIFLGDNVYMRGIPSEGSPNYQEALTKLNIQIDSITSAGARPYFIPGNHDWDNSGPDGLNSVRRQSAYVERKLGKGSFLPGSGCPGPAVVFNDSFFKVVALDSEWWLRTGRKPVQPEDGCTIATEDGVINSLKNELKLPPAAVPPETRQFTIFTSHHPLESDGPHGYGSNCGQNAGCPAYAAMKKRLLSAFSGQEPLICAAGHDHILQIIKDRPGCGYYVTSGAMSQPTAVKARDGSVYASAELGFIRLDRHDDGRMVLTVKTVAADRAGKTPFKIELNR